MTRVVMSPADVLRLAEAAADMASPDRDRDAARLKEQSNAVTAAVEHSLRTDRSAALRLVAALPMFWQDTGRVDEGRRLTEQAIDAWTDRPTPEYASALVGSAELAFRQGDQAAAEERCKRAIAAAEASGNTIAAALAHVNLARIAYRAGDGERIERHAQQALDIGGEDIGARRGGLHMLAWAAHTRGDLELATRRFEDSLALRQSLGDRFAVTVEIANLADLAAERGDLAGAAVRLREALDVAREIHSAYLVLNLIPSIAAVAAGTGDWERAARLMGATDAMIESTHLEPDPGAWQPSIEAAGASHGDAFERERLAGRQLPVDEAVELAVRVADFVAGSNTSGLSDED